MIGETCPRCQGFAKREPGGLRCLACGYTALFRWVLPSNHWLAGGDSRNRTRQRALDRALMRPGPAVVFDMLERLEPRREDPPAAAS